MSRKIDGSLELNGVVVPPGDRRTLQLAVARRMTAGEVSLPVCVVNGARPGPRLFVSAAVHGDEINGVEIIRRLLRRPILRKLRGALIAVPVVNVYGFLSHTRYLPDRRDLNRCFPGSPSGSLASRIAHVFMEQIVANATHGIDLHTGSLHRTNLPHVRATLELEGTEALARSFGAPVIIDSPVREGSLRHAVADRGVPVIVYEAGEALRFDELAIRAGLTGVIAAMRALGMLPETSSRRRRVEPFVAHGSTWIRAPESGLVSTRLKLGARVREGELLATISDPLGEEELRLESPTSGVLIGKSNLPLANEGDALFHVGVFKRLDPVADEVDFFHGALDVTP
jgi:hypothetical protein